MLNPYLHGHNKRISLFYNRSLSILWKRFLYLLKYLSYCSSTISISVPNRHSWRTFCQIVQVKSPCMLLIIKSCPSFCNSHPPSPLDAAQPRAVDPLTLYQSNRAGGAGKPLNVHSWRPEKNLQIFNPQLQCTPTWVRTQAWKPRFRRLLPPTRQLINQKKSTFITRKLNSLHPRTGTLWRY